MDHERTGGGDASGYAKTDPAAGAASPPSRGAASRAFHGAEAHKAVRGRYRRTRSELRGSAGKRARRCRQWRQCADVGPTRRVVPAAGPPGLMQACMDVGSPCA
jgi:hypothetical protein